MISDNQDIQQPDKSSSQIVLYQPDSTVSLEVKLDVARDTVWLTQAQMCVLFNKVKSTISYHINNIFTEGELDKSVAVRKIRTTTQHGAIKDKTQTDEVTIYNLDVVSPQATESSQNEAHNRFLIIDNDVYIMGDSIKKLGHSLTTVLKTMFQPEDILSKLKQNICVIRAICGTIEANIGQF